MLNEHRFNDRNFKLNVLAGETAISINKMITRTICWGLKNGRRVKGEEFYPLEWFNKKGQLLPEKEKFIEEVTMNFERIYTYNGNMNEKKWKTLDASDDEQLMEIICLYTSPYVSNPYVNKKVIRPILSVERIDLVNKKKIEEFSKKSEVYKELGMAMQKEELLDKYLLLLGYNPDLLKDAQEKFIALMSYSEGNLDKVYDVISEDIQTSTQKAVLYTLLNTYIVKKIEGKGYFYGELYMGASFAEALHFLYSPKNEQLKNKMISYLPEGRKRTLHLLSPEAQKIENIQMMNHGLITPDEVTISDKDIL